MRHYSLEKWIDFARNVIREDEKAKMQIHIETGCPTCQKELSLWRRLQQTAQCESGYEPSDGAIRTVQAIFANQRAHRPHSTKLQVAALLFDSLRTPLLAGVRSSVSTSRQLLFGAASYRIDVRIEPQMDSDKVVLIGQVLNSTDPDECVSQLPVTLVRGNKILAESVTSQFGEFQLECQLEGGFRLTVILPGRGEVSLPLIEPTLSQGEALPDSTDANRVRSSSKAEKKGTRTKG